MIHVHHLDGCAPSPLAHYLKALGILRLVSEQADPEARGWWNGDRFKLATRLQRADLEEFFLIKYQPTPIFNPWGGRSGYYPDSSEKNARLSLKKIESSSCAQLAPYRDTIKTIRSVIRDTTNNKKPSEKDKERLISALRFRLRGKPSLWLDTVTALTGSDEDLGFAKPAIFGTGGNEGSGSYTSAYMAAIEEAVIGGDWDQSLSNVLFAESNSPNCYWNQSMGQFVPDAPSTPWDMLLAFEGALLLRSSISTRVSATNTGSSRRWVASPFFVSLSAYGYPSEARMDEKAVNKGKELPGRGEQWFPLWMHPFSANELQHLFTQGRANTARGRATDGWSMARAVTSFGVSRGVAEFIRYGYQQRNNQATHFAVPLGRFRVTDKRAPSVSCLDDIETWISRLNKIAQPVKGDDARRVPNRLQQANRLLSDAVFAASQFPDKPEQLTSILQHLAAIEGVMANGSGFSAQPIPVLRPEWVQSADDGTPEFRLALSFALQARGFGKDSGIPVDKTGIRHHWLPLDEKRPWRFAISGTGSQTRLDVRPEVVMHGRRGIDDTIALIERRLIEAAQRGDRHLPLAAAPRASACNSDLVDLLAGEVDLDRTLSLARALMALDRRAWAEEYIPVDRPSTTDWPDEAWMVLRLCFLPHPIRLPHSRKLDIAADPQIFRRLANGDAASAIDLALHRLRVAGINCTIRAGNTTPEIARLWAAALAFPINSNLAARYARRLDPPKENHA